MATVSRGKEDKQEEKEAKDGEATIHCVVWWEFLEFWDRDKFVNWVLGVCDYRQRRDQGLVGID